MDDLKEAKEIAKDKYGDNDALAERLESLEELQITSSEGFDDFLDTLISGKEDDDTEVLSISNSEDLARELRTGTVELTHENIEHLDFGVILEQCKGDPDALKARLKNLDMSQLKVQDRERVTLLFIKGMKHEGTDALVEELGIDNPGTLEDDKWGTDDFNVLKKLAQELFGENLSTADEIARILGEMDHSEALNSNGSGSNSDETEYLKEENIKRLLELLEIGTDHTDALGLGINHEITIAAFVEAEKEGKGYIDGDEFRKLRQHAE